MELLIGGCGFVLFFLYDWNRIYWKRKGMASFFWIGCLCQIAAAVLMILQSIQAQQPGFIWLLGLAFLSLVGLLYTLFFALPFDSTYREEADGHKVCRSGIYGWCRHPGIWWFFGCFLCLGFASADSRKLWYGIGLSLCNLGYAWYQDRFIFPQEFSDYLDYRREIPFLLPGKRHKDGEDR